jgi:hypothetical protein
MYIYIYTTCRAVSTGHSYNMPRFFDDNIMYLCAHTHTHTHTHTHVIYK